MSPTGTTTAPVRAPAADRDRSESAPARMWAVLSRITGAYAPLVVLCLIGLVLLSVSRALLMLWQTERVAATGIVPTMLLQGLRVDIIQLGQLCVIPLLAMPLFAHRRGWPLWQRLTQFWVVFAIAVLLFMEIATPPFIGEYDVRPNRYFVEYLKYPREVFSTLWGGYRWQVLGGVLLTAVGVFATARLMRPWGRLPPRWRSWPALLAWPLVLLVLAFAIRSSTDHRPANPALFALTTDTMVNSLILNSTWSVLYEIYRMRDEATSSEIYGHIDEDAILAAVTEARAEYGQAPLLGHPELPTLTQLQPTRERERPLNLVIVLEESLGATFVESLGGVPVTPELEKLKHEGWWFEQLYATGTRSVRGIEAVAAGFPPTPAQSTVKLSLAQDGFFTLAELLQREGYHTSFIYGGESHFDNMRSFFNGNGVQQVIDQNDYPSPVFKGSWGVSDEDLLNRAHEEYLALHERGTPFFSLVFTSSNHSPFEFPDGRIKLYDAERATDRNAVKYADYALGRFFDQARAADYWEDTLFVVVADHDIRVRGDSLIPVERFHIPALIVGADLEPRRIRSVASQIDLGPTLLSLMGISAAHPMPGRDISAESDDLPGRAMMQFEQHFGWLEGKELIVLRPEKAPMRAEYDPASKRLNDAEPIAGDDPRAVRALAHVHLPSWLYRERLYRLPD